MNFTLQNFGEQIPGIIVGDIINHFGGEHVEVPKAMIQFQE